jgi:ATP-dependent Lon protease
MRTASAAIRSLPVGVGLVSGGTDEHPGLFREVTEGPGSGLKILNQKPSGAAQESVLCRAESVCQSKRTGR